MSRMTQPRHIQSHHIRMQRRKRNFAVYRLAEIAPNISADAYVAPNAMVCFDMKREGERGRERDSEREIERQRRNRVREQEGSFQTIKESCHV